MTTVSRLTKPNLSSYNLTFYSTPPILENEALTVGRFCFMPEARSFGAKLRELRIKARFTQRELARLIGVDFTYLSKIENGVLPPPSEKVILRLAQVLKADQDELLILAGRIPEDIAELLRNKRTLQILRSQKRRMA
jgi:transcriptional regulator with XRE-family HTH domain